MVSGYSTSTNIPRVDGLSTNPGEMGRHTSFKATGMLLIEKLKNLLWSPCAAHCIDLMLENIGNMKQVKETLDQAKIITSVIYNSLKVVNLMKVFTKNNMIFHFIYYT